MAPPAADAAAIDGLFREYRSGGSRSVRNRLVEMHLHLADHHVGRFSHSSGVSPDDLRQIALIAILHAVERFDPDRGASFRTFASLTIEGELKRHLRDRSWSVRPPRSVQELSLRVRTVTEELSQRFGRAPTVDEIADEAGVSTDDVLEALEAGQARSATPLDAPLRPGNEDSSLARLLGALDPGYRSVDEHDELSAVLTTLGPREQQVLHMRFIEELSQPEIAERIGVSQSYVSRLLRATLAQLRSELTHSG